MTAAGHGRGDGRAGSDRVDEETQRVIDSVLTDPGIVRSSTVIALATQVPYRILPLATAP